MDSGRSIRKWRYGIKLERIREWMEKQSEKERGIVGGDFNARTGTEGGREVEDEQRNRESKDRKINGEVRKLVKMLGKVGWEILNGTIAGDEEGEYTYTGGRGETVIDYVLGDGNTTRGIERMEVGYNVESDHRPLVVTVKTGEKERRKKEERERTIGSGKWLQRMREVYEKRMERVRVEEARL